MGRMIVRRILFFAFLLGTWAQATGACVDAHFPPTLAQNPMGFAAPAISEDFAVIGGEHRCECPATGQDAQSAVSGSSKSLLASYVEGAGVLLNSSNPASVAPAVRTRASSYIARSSGRPPYLLVSHLRQ